MFSLFLAIRFGPAICPCSLCDCVPRELEAADDEYGRVVRVWQRVEISCLPAVEIHGVRARHQRQAKAAVDSDPWQPHSSLPAPCCMQPSTARRRRSPQLLSSNCSGVRVGGAAGARTEADLENAATLSGASSPSPQDSVGRFLMPVRMRPPAAPPTSTFYADGPRMHTALLLMCPLPH